MVWRKSGFAGAALPLAIYLLQLVLNAAWTPIFFGLRRPALAFFEIIMLLLSIVATIATFHSHSVAAAWLLLPYLAWVMLAATLNFTIWRLNRGSVP
jgi:benzodiazapine receptor